MLYLLTIRKSQVKDYVTIKELLDILATFHGHNYFSVRDVGFHMHGKYNQLHLHAIVFATNPVTTWVNGFRCYWKPANSYVEDPLREQKMSKYCHSDDYGHPMRLQQLLDENYYQYHYHDYT